MRRALTVSISCLNCFFCFVLGGRPRRNNNRQIIVYRTQNKARIAYTVLSGVFGRVCLLSQSCFAICSVRSTAHHNTQTQTPTHTHIIRNTTQTHDQRLCAGCTCCVRADPVCLRCALVACCACSCFLLPVETDVRGCWESLNTLNTNKHTHVQMQYTPTRMYVKITGTHTNE